MTQFAPMTVLPRRMQPGRITAPGAISTSGSIKTWSLMNSTPFCRCFSKVSSKAALAARYLAFASDIKIPLSVLGQKSIRPYKKAPEQG